VSSGDKKTIKTTFPKEYHAKDLAGKDVEFAITINEVKTHVLPEINKEFFKNAGFKATTEEDFRKEVEHNIKYHTKDLNIKSRKDSIMMQLKKDIEFDLPKGLVNQEAHEMKNNAVNWMMKQNSQMSKEQISSLLQTEQFVKDASSKIQSWLLFDALKKEFDFKIEDKDLEEFLDEQSKRFRDSKEEKEFRDNAISDDKKKENYKSLVLENKIMNKVASLVKIKTKDISYVSAIEKQQ
jgi:trigger factor